MLAEGFDSPSSRYGVRGTHGKTLFPESLGALPTVERWRLRNALALLYLRASRTLPGRNLPLNDYVTERKPTHEREESWPPLQFDLLPSLILPPSLLSSGLGRYRGVKASHSGGRSQGGARKRTTVFCEAEVVASSVHSADQTRLERLHIRSEFNIGEHCTTTSPRIVSVEADAL